MGRWKIVRGTVPPEAMRLIASYEPGELPAGATALRRGNTRETFLVPGLGIFKILHRVGTRAAIASLFAPSVPAREYDLTMTAIERGVPAARPLFCAERRTLGLLREAAIVFEIVPDSVSLQHVIEGRFPRPGVARQPRAEVRRLLSQVGAILAGLHRSGGAHGDPSPDNWLVRDAAPDEPVLIDWPFSVFAEDHTLPGSIGRRLLIRAAAGRYRLTSRDLIAALDGFVAQGPGSATFAKLRIDDLRKMVCALMHYGTPAREILACLRAYARASGQSVADTMLLVDALETTLTPIMRDSTRRTLRKADRTSRKTASVREDGTLLCHRREVSLGDVRAAFAQGGGAFELRKDDDALRAWRNACVFARSTLPARLHVACQIESRGGGYLLLERPSQGFEKPVVICASRLARFVRLLHAFGFRFTDCGEGTIVEQPASLGPFTARQGSGYVLDDAGAVEFAPEAPMERSAETVASWLRESQGERAAAEFLAAANWPLRFRL